MIPFFITLYALLCSMAVVRAILEGQTISWVELIARDGVKFTARNAFASTVFKGKIYLTGGRSDLHSMYNLLESTKEADVWVSEHGDLWHRLDFLVGDYFAQNIDVIQPGPIAPWFQRYGHTLTSIDLDGDGLNDYMILMGGFASSPSNDVWMSADGEMWVYCGLQPWSPRGFHAVSVMRGKLYMVGGSPLTNDVWVLDPVNDIRMQSRISPLTRAMYLNYTFDLTWTNLVPDGASPFSPRVGMSLINHWWFNETNTSASYIDAEPRLLMIGGYGAWRENDPRYDGVHTWPEVWASKDGITWDCLNSNASFGGRAFMGASILHMPHEPRRDFKLSMENASAKVYIFGGGDIGFSTDSSKVIYKMDGRLDAWSSRNGINWTQINYQEGGGKTVVKLFSTQEWTAAIVDTRAVYVGVWGHSVVAFNTTDGNQPADRLIFIGGDRTLGGSMSNTVYESKKGLFCDIEGVPCSYKGSCGKVDVVENKVLVNLANDNDNSGCICNFPYIGEYCESQVLVSLAFVVKIKYVAIFALSAVSMIAIQIFI